MKNNFNIVIAGVGGQGLVTLLQIIDEAAFLEGHDIRSSELHGLSQRGGKVLAHVRFGQKIYSPLVVLGNADLIIATELTEGLRAINFVNPETKLLINKNLLAFLGGLPEKEILERLPKKNLYIVPASQTCQEKLGKEVVSTIYLLGYAVKNNLIPLKAKSVLSAIKNKVPQKYQELNIKAFNLANL